MSSMQAKPIQDSKCPPDGKGAGACMPEQGIETQKATVNQSGELWVLLEEFLAIIIKAVGAHAGSVRMLAPNGMELQMVGAIGLPLDVCQRESVVGLDCKLASALRLRHVKTRVLGEDLVVEGDL